MIISIEINGGRYPGINDAYNMFIKYFKLPGYFSFNLSSLDECMNDLSWFDEKVSFEFKIKDHKSFIKNDPKMRREVLDILKNIDLNYEKEEKSQQFILILE